MPQNKLEKTQKTTTQNPQNKQKTSSDTTLSALGDPKEMKSRWSSGI